MKRVRCPKCDEFITFDENKYEPGQRLVFVCPACSKQFASKLGVSKLRKTQKEENEETPQPDAPYGSLTVIENVFHYKQIIPLHLGENAISDSRAGVEKKNIGRRVGKIKGRITCLYHAKVFLVLGIGDVRAVCNSRQTIMFKLLPLRSAVID